MASQSVGFLPDPALEAFGKVWVFHLKATPKCVFYKKKKKTKKQTQFLSLVLCFSQHLSAPLSHYPTSSSPCPPFVFVLLVFLVRGCPHPPPPADTVEKQANDSERQAEAEKQGGRNLLLCCWAANLCERKSSHGTKRAPSFVPWSTWGLFLLWRYNAPLLTDPPPLCHSPRF